MKYRPDIDGLRALAVLLVVIYHAKLGSLSGGYVGVDIFFVISGYLITKILLRSIGQGNFSYFEFWTRRIRRLVPALAFLTLFVVISSPVVMLPMDLEKMGPALISQPFLLANVFYWRSMSRGYFDGGPELRPLLHTWSLGVEEQFYVLYPLGLSMLIARNKTGRSRWMVMLMLASLSFVLCGTMTQTRVVFSFFNLPTRAWEFLLGGLLVFASSASASRILRESLGLLGLLLILWTSYGYSAETIFPGWAALLPCVGAACIIWSSSDRTSGVGRLLSWKPFVKIGKISYSVYLYHWPLMAYVEYLGFPLKEHQALGLILVFLSLLLGYLSWRFIEEPYRRKQVLSSDRGVLWFALSYLLFCLVAGGVYIQSNGLRATWNDAALQYQDEMQKRQFVRDLNLDAPTPGNLGLSKNEKVDFLLWGDSHAISLAAGIDSVASSQGLRGLQITHLGRAPLVRSHVKRFQKTQDKRLSFVLSTLQRTKAEVVFVSGFWSFYAREDFKSNLDQTVTTLRKTGARVVLIPDIPQQKGSPCRILALSTRFPWIPSPKPTSQEQYNEKNKRINRILKDSGAEILDVSQFLLGLESLSLEGKPVYMDDDHLTDSGSRLLTPIFAHWFKENLKNR